MTRWFFWDGDALAAEMEQGNGVEDAPALLIAQVMDAFSVIQRQHKLLKLAEGACEYLYYPDSFVPLALLQPGDSGSAVYHYHVDPNGCPTRMTDVQGQVVWSAIYDAWGRLNVVHAEAVPQPLRFQGQYFDEETGLHYNRYRYYDPCAGQYVGRDPIGLAGGMNNYGYGFNPVGWIDPFGLTSCQLASAMEKNGTPRPKDSAAHHIVPENAKRAKAARDILERYGILNGHENGVFLPNKNNNDGMSGVLHNGRHPDDYIDEINRRITNADAVGGKDAVVDELNKISGILSGADRDADWGKVLL